MNMNFIEGLELTGKCLEQIQERYAWEMWLTFQPAKDDGKVKPFKSFLNEIKTHKIENKEDFNKSIDKCIKLAQKHKKRRKG